MDAVDILKVCLRRWYVMLPILLGAAGVSYQLLQAEETTYTAAASYGLVQPALSGEEDKKEANPLGDGGNALVGAAIEAQLNSRETQSELGSDGIRGWGPGNPVNHRSYYVQIPQFETTYEVRAWGENEQEVRAVIDRVIEAAPDIADELQVRAGVPPPQRYQPFVLAPTQVDELPATSGMKLVIAVMGVGLMMGAAWSIVADRGLRWRQAHRQATRPVGDSLQQGAPDLPVAAAARSDASRDGPPPDSGGAAPSAKPDAGSQQSTGSSRGTAGGNGAASGGTSRGRPRGRPGGNATATKVGAKPANRR